MYGEMKRMFSGRGFLASVCLSFAAMFSGTAWPQESESLAAGHFLALAGQSYHCRTVSFLLPLAAVAVWSDSFLEEKKNGFLKACLPRQNRRTYMENKILAVALGGILSWILAGFLLLFVDFLLFFPMEQKGQIAFPEVWESLAPLFRGSLLGGILASMGGTAAALSGSVYLVFGLPLAGYYFCLILQERYFPEALWLYPPQWLLGDADWGPGKEGLWLFLLLLLALTVGIHGGVLYGKLEES